MSEVDLYAEFQNEENESVEVDLEFVDDYEDAVAQAREEMEMDNDMDDPELTGINAYAMNRNLQELADKISWDDLFSGGDYEIIEDFLGLDEDRQLKALWLSDFHAISLREAMDTRDSETVYVVGNEDDLIDDWLQLVDRDTMSMHINKEKVLKDYYRLRETLPDGSVIYQSE